MDYGCEVVDTTLTYILYTKFKHFFVSISTRVTSIFKDPNVAKTPVLPGWLLGVVFLSDKANNYIVSKSDSNKRYYEPDFRMLKFFIDNIFVMFDCPEYAWHTWCWALNNNHIMLGGHVFQQTVLLFSQICSFIHMKRTSYRGFYASFNFMFPITIQVWRLYWSHFAGLLLDPLYFESLSRCSILSVGPF